MAAMAHSPTERLVEVVSRPSFAEGTHGVGVDRVITEAGIARATP